MKELILIALACALGSMVGVHMVDGTMKRIFSLLLSLAVLSVAMEPMRASVRAVHEIPERVLAVLTPDTEAGKEAESAAESSAEKLIADRMETILSAWIERKYALLPENFQLHVTCSVRTGAVRGEVFVMLAEGVRIDPDEFREQIGAWCDGWTVYVQR